MKTQHKLPDILTQIVDQRRADLQKLGYTYGYPIPPQRVRPIVPFLSQRGVILEIKRASPSKGDIAQELNTAQTATYYESAGAAAISVLTEEHWFHGSLLDLIEAGKVASHTAILRKDFLLDEEEISVAYRCGADAVLLIARILEKEKLISMTRRCAELGITAFIEVRLESDIEKVRDAEKTAPGTVVVGVNARDLKDFSIDLLMPASLLSTLRNRVVFESGIRSPAAAAFVGCMGFHGLLLGEAAAGNPAKAQSFVTAFEHTAEKCTTPSKTGRFWIAYATQLDSKRKQIAAKDADSRTKSIIPKPFVKICGLTDKDDALLAAKLGADFLGFIFSKKSRRQVTAETVKKIVTELKKNGYRSDPARADHQPFLVAVITESESAEANDAFTLVRAGLIDVVQFHGCPVPSYSDDRFGDIPRYAAINIGNSADIERISALNEQGHPRILLDAKLPGLSGGTGKTIDEALIKTASRKTKLWLAGGITPDNVTDFIQKYQPELIDIASGIESSPRKKDDTKMKNLFAKITAAAGTKVE
jgi:indole-3-glycerol phosphate synthase/phosphoribosylanthranilate isomerase